MVIFYLVCTVFVTVISGNHYEESTVVLSPVELIDEVLEERRKTQEQGYRTQGDATLLQVSTTEEAATEPNDEETSMKRRKVWSRWGKWGKCSVTCGGGAMTRRRVCAGGRCAPGELEVQRRSCARAACAARHGDGRDTD